MSTQKPKGTNGRKDNQKMKPYLVMKYLLKHTDENNPITGEELAAVLLADYGIHAERRSIYRDIEAINTAIIMLENGCDIQEAKQILDEDEYDSEKLIRKNKGGFFACPREYEENDIRLLAECVYSAKFLSEQQTEALSDIVCSLVNQRQAKRIKHDVLLVDRVRTNNAEVLNNIAVINEAMSKELNGEKHVPEKISFKYLKYTIDDMKNQVERRKGEIYTTNPFALLINDGNYYLFAFDEQKHRIIHYRVDRMKGVKRIGEKRIGDKEFFELDMKSYTKRVFSMYGGKEQRVTLQFNAHLLDAVIDRFGKKDARYHKIDERHFEVNVIVDVSKQFFGWLFGFASEVKIVSPVDVKEEFVKYLDKVRKQY